MKIFRFAKKAVRVFQDVGNAESVKALRLLANDGDLNVYGIAAAALASSG